MDSVVDNFGCVGNKIKVAGGHYVDLANPDPASIDLNTIASALSKMCRFGCHSPVFYSVAEHCVHATLLAEADRCSNEALRAVLLHDAAEAYIGDVVKPLKVMLPDYAVVERRMEAAVAERFGVSFDGVDVKRYDQLMLKAEKTRLWPDDSEQWAGFAGLPNRDVDFLFWMPEQAESQFLSLAHSIGV